MGIKNDNACSQATTKAGDNMIGKTNQSSPSPLCAPNQKTPSEKATPASEQSENVGAKIARHKPLAWSILGLALCRAGLIVGSYGSYRHSDEGIYSDGVMLVALAVLAVLWLLIAITKCHLSRQVVRRIAFASIILEAFSLTMTGALVIGPPEMNVAGNHFLASTFCTLGGLACMSYWLRRARDCTAITAVIYAFGALFVSELLIFTSIFMENGISYFYAAVLVLLQFPCMLLARTKPLACDIKTISSENDFFNFAKNTMTSKVFLATICVSIGVLACADGFLRGYPDGLPIAFRATTRFADLVLILAFCVAIIVFTCRQHYRVMTVGIFVTMEALACIALLCYSAWPDALDIGAIFTTNLNALLVGFSWYIILAFMSYGWRCPYYYAIAGWIVWLGCRGIARITLINVTAVSQNDLLMLAAVFTNVLKFGDDVQNFPMYLILGNVLFSLMADSTSSAMGSILESAPLIKKVRVSKMIFPLEKVLFTLVNFAISLIAVVIVMLFFRIPPTVNLLAMPILLVFMLLFCAGLGMLLSSLAVFFRDVCHLWGVVITAWTYATPLFYPVGLLPDWMQAAEAFNPMYHYVCYFRDIAMYNTVPGLTENLICLGMAAITFAIGFAVFKATEKKFILYV